MNTRAELRKKILKRTKEQINEKFAGREIHIIKAVNLLGDLDSVSNLLHENETAWKERAPTGDAQQAFTELTKNASGIDAQKQSLITFIEREMSAEFPTFSVLATPVLGAKLLASAGSKKRLACLPASTIQVLGAEKALFAHLRNKATSPKHGHLFNHPFLQKLPRQKRGKAARVIAGKLSIALKLDFFNGKADAQAMLKEIEEKVAAIAQEPIKERISQPPFAQARPRFDAPPRRFHTTPREHTHHAPPVKRTGDQRDFNPSGHQYLRKESKDRRFGKKKFDKPHHLGTRR